MLLHGIAVTVDHKAAIAETHRFGCTEVFLLGPFQERLDAVHQLPRTERLYHIIICAERKACNALLFRRLGGEHDDRDIAAFLDILADLFTSGVREHEVKDDQQRFLFQEGCNRVFTFLKVEDPEARLFEIDLHHLCDLPVVLNNEYRLHGYNYTFLHVIPPKIRGRERFILTSQKA